MTNSWPPGPSEQPQPLPRPGPMPSEPQRPEPPKKKTGWIIGGVAGLIVLVLLAVGALFAFGVFDSDNKSSDDEKVNPSKSTSAPVADHKYVENLCAQLDFSEAEAIAPLREPVRSSGRPSVNNGGYLHCYGELESDSTHGLFTVEVAIEPVPRIAASTYDRQLQIQGTQGEKGI